MSTLALPVSRTPSALSLSLAWLGLAALTLAWDASGLDVAVMRLIGTASGFPWQHQVLLESVLHNGGRALSWVAFAGLVFWALAPARFQPRSAPARAERLTVLALVVLSLLTVSLLKYRSHTSCPWEWTMFGGTATPGPFWPPHGGDGGSGHCFPGGHASGALAFVALCLPWLWSPVEGRPRSTGRRWLAVVVVAGVTAGLTQTLRGAHPPSHTLWTALICGAVSLAGWWLALPTLRSARSRP